MRLSGLSHAAQVEKLIEGGATLIQLREKFAAPREFYESAKQAVEIARHSHVKIIINDRADIALAVKADGVHLGQDDLPPEQARKILGENAIIGFSTHNLEQAISAVRLPIDYLAIGPVFTTLTKENPDKVTGTETVRRVRAAVGDFPLVAIGGITVKNLSSVLNAGADSAAIISELFLDKKKIAERLRNLLESRQTL